MPMRMTGLMSGMDTESVIKELVAVRQKKVDTAKKAQTKLEWKQDAWKSLNTKIKNLQSKYVNNLRFSSAYAKLKTNVSDSSKANVITGENATASVQNLKITHLAKTAYFTGGEIKTTGEEKLTALSKVSDFIGDEVTLDENSSFKFKLGDAEAVDIKVGPETTISDILNQIKEAGDGKLNATFDEKTQRFFISAKESGKDLNFTISGGDENADKIVAGLGLKAVPEGEEAGDGEATYVKGQNAEIYLNGAKFENTNNVFEINGLTITALDKTEGEGLTLTTEQDTDGIYDMIKNFFKEYNSLINEMDKLYNAEKAKDMEPLTDEEKEDMSDSEIEKWEKKIKDQLLRRDDSLYSVADGLKSIFAKGVEVDGKTMYLSEFGINTLGYFLAPENEKSAYHIDGDEDDESTSGNADKLKSAIANDPDKVINFFTSIFNNMYKKMNDLSTSVEGTRSFGNFYDDKKMKTEYDGYKTKIKDLEQALADYEDKWYKKFSKMETAMAKLQSNTSAVTSMLGQ